MRAWMVAGLLLAAPPASAADVEFRAVVDCATHPGAPHLDIYSPQAHCLAPPVITEADFQRLDRQWLGGGTFVRAELTPEAQERFYYATRDHRFRPMALMVEGKPMRVWIVRAPSHANWLILNGGYVTEKQLNDVADRFYAAGGHR
ncbi:MAG TPA: hypothetical protein VN723_07955 [Rhizomicrobium sp.]|nr:hypothetical protein [Rhizomicrobium sp.]